METGSRGRQKEIPEGIKAIIFDLGGVIVNLETERTLHEFLRLGIEKVDFGTHPGNQPDFFSLYETGKISDTDFIQGLSKYMHAHVSVHEIKNAWNCMILDLPRTQLEILEKLKGSYRLFLLSNTNNLHIRYFLDDFERQYPELKFESFFEKVYYSHEIGKRKPDVEVYEYILDDNGLQANECLFIDDNLVNVEAARQAGIHAIHHPRNAAISYLTES